MCSLDLADFSALCPWRCIRSKVVRHRCQKHFTDPYSPSKTPNISHLTILSCLPSPTYPSDGNSSLLRSLLCSVRCLKSFNWSKPGSLWIQPSTQPGNCLHVSNDCKLPQEIAAKGGRRVESRSPHSENSSHLANAKIGDERLVELRSLISFLSSRFLNLTYSIAPARFCLPQLHLFSMSAQAKFQGHLLTQYFFCLWSQSDSGKSLNI